MHVLGLTTMGDAAATLLSDGEIVAAVEEERFSRRKHHVGVPYRAIEHCLEAGGIALADVDHVALYWRPWVVGRKALVTARALAASPGLFGARVERGAEQVGGSYLQMLRLPRLLRARYGPGRFRTHYLDHHRCHAASAFLVSPFERAAVLTADGAGEATTTSTAVGAGTAIRTLDEVRLPHSLGQFYSAVTAFLGFDMFEGDEWKVMGLAAYGEPRHIDFLGRVLSPTADGGFRLDVHLLDHHLAKRGRFSAAAVDALGPPRAPGGDITPRHQDVAASAQRVVEDVVLGMLERLHRRTGEHQLCLAGGVAFNSVMNGRVARESPFGEVFVQPAAGDAGCSLGAALLVHHARSASPRRTRMEHAYLGPSFDSAACAAALRDDGLVFDTLPDDELLPRVAELLADGAVVGWFQGRAEFGPRALGNRSFLADPRDAEARERLNHTVKLREWFRPLAPSLLEEAAEDVFGRPYRDPFMTTVATVAAAARERIPAVVHVDGTARPQTVSRATNPRFWGLIDEFRRLTGVPVLLNTSFNVREPIVLTPADAVRTFRASGFEVLVLGDHVVVRDGEPASIQSAAARRPSSSETRGS